jgi:hypothetical protein
VLVGFMFTVYRAYMIDFLMCNSAIILQDIVVLRACGSDKLLNHGLGMRQLLEHNIYDTRHLVPVFPQVGHRECRLASRRGTWG